MTSTLIITLCGPMQYWAASTGPRQKHTHDHPTKTAVIGLVANALGRDFEDGIADLADLTFAATTVHPGVVEVDFKTAGTATYPALAGDLIAGIKLDGTIDANGRPQIASTLRKNPKWGTQVKESAGVAQAEYTDGRLIWEEYLADAEFRVALTGDDALATQVHQALRRPARSVFLGRRAYPPSKPLVDAGSLRHGDLTDNMEAFDTGGDLWAEVRPGTPDSYLIKDQPVAYGQRQRSRRRAEIFRPATSTTGEESDDFFATALE